MKMKVCAKRCDQCLFSNKRVVSKGRADGIMRKIRGTDSHFIRHKSPKGEEHVCRGSYDFHPGQMIRISHRLNYVEFVDPDTGEVQQKGTQ